MDVEQKAGYQAIDRICDYYQSIHTLNVFPDVKPGYLRPLIPDAAPEKGEEFQVIADDYQRLIVPGLTHWQHPSFFAYYPTGSTFEGILADLYATSVSNPGFNWSCSPACTELELVVMDWVAKLLGLSPAFLNSSGTGGGCIQSGTSDAALISIVAARYAYQRLYPDVKLESLVIYTTTQTHSLGIKAGMVLSLQVRCLEVSSNDNYSLRGSTLKAALEEDTAQGLYPFVVVATLGTTSSAAIDNLPEIKAIAESYPNLWIHVDAAWAGMALCCPEYRDMLFLKEVNEIASSVTVNIHKWGLMQYELSSLWVRDRKLLNDALDVTPTFLRTPQAETGGATDFRNWHLALGRRFRSLKLWFVLRSYGVQGLQAHIRKTIALNELFVSLVKSSKILTLVTPPVLALSVFRLQPSKDSSQTLESLNALNEKFFSRLCDRKEIYLTQTTLNGVYCIRFAVGAAKTTEEHIRQAYELIEEEGRNAIAESLPVE